LYLLALQEAATEAAEAGLSLFQRRVTRSDIVYLTSQLAIMIDAGVPLSNALASLTRHIENPTFRAMLEKIQQAVEAGDDLSTALARYPKQFDKTYVNLVKASEASGAMAPMLDRIAIQARTELETLQKVRGALMYPAVMLVMCVAACVFLLTYVFPKITPMFATRGIELPRPTQIMMAISHALTHEWYWFLAGLVVLVGGFLYARRQPWGRLALDWLWLRVPIFGTLFRKSILTRCLRTLASTITAGVPVLDSLELTAGVANNVFYERSWRQVHDQVTTGREIHEALDGNPLFPSTLVQMIASGEQTGKLGPVLNKVSDYFESEIATTVKSVTTLIEPLMVTVMGTIIGSIALAMLLPIFQLSSHAR
jgi:type IV pilus assembly protein PilC